MTTTAGISAEAEDLIADAITEQYGERCPDYEPECWCCKVWKQYDALATLAAEVEALRRERDRAERTLRHALEVAKDQEARADSLAAELAQCRETLGWIDAWVSNPVGSYSVLALDGLFAMTRDRARTALKGTSHEPG